MIKGASFKQLASLFMEIKIQTNFNLIVLLNKLLFSFLMISCFTAVKQLHAQNAFCVTYEYKMYEKDRVNPTLTTFPDMKVKLICNDTLSFNFITTGDENEIKEFEKIGKKRIANHSYLTYCTNKKNVAVHYWPSEKKMLMVMDSAVTRKWVIADSVKTFMGYRCQEAYSLNKTGDTLFAFFSADIPGPFGPGKNTWGLPGLVLESFDAETGQYLIAQKIEKINYEMQLPKDVKLTVRKHY